MQTTILMFLFLTTYTYTFNRQTAQDEKRRLESLLNEMEEEREEAEAQCEITEDRNRKLQVIKIC